jgi:hypothetical protein
MEQNAFVEELFKLLADNKKFPAYQAERRIDIFINFFLEEILENHFQGSKVTYVAPEFPLKKDKGNQSTNVDYLCVKKEENGKKKILFVELKTNADSFDAKQCGIYLEYKLGTDGKTWHRCLTDLGIIATSGSMPFNKRKKYFHLLKALYHAGVFGCAREDFDNIDEILEREGIAEEWDKPKIKRQFTQALKKLEPCLAQTENLAIDIVYLAPVAMKQKMKQEFREITFIVFEELQKVGIRTNYQDIWKNMLNMLV